MAEGQRTRLNVEGAAAQLAPEFGVARPAHALASISGAASSLLQGEPGLPASTRVEPGLLDLRRSQPAQSPGGEPARHDAPRFGALELKQEWYSLEEIIGSALNRLDEALRRHPMEVRLPHDLPLLFIDGVLIEQVVNLIENALKYTPAGAPLTLSAAVEAGSMRVTLDDSGPGLPRAMRNGSSTASTGARAPPPWASDSACSSAAASWKPTAAISAREPTHRGSVVHVRFPGRWRPLADQPGN